MADQESEEEQSAREFREKWQAENDLTAWLTKFQGDLVGDAATVRDHLDELLPVLRRFVDRLEVRVEPPETSEADHYVGFDGLAVKVTGW